MIQGIVFDHRGETPGLGARITDAEIQERYQGKKVFKEENGEKVIESVTMLKAEKGNNPTDYEVDGMSGATMTANGVNDMLKNYLEYYKPFFDKTLKTTTKTVEEPDTTIEPDSAMVANDSTLAVTDSLQTQSATDSVVQ